MSQAEIEKPTSLADMRTPLDALRWALRRIETSLGQGDYFERASALLAAADAHLIAAAPDLLANCVKALAAWEGTGPAIDLDELRAAIAKAEGRS